MRFIHTADLHLDSPMRGLERYEGAPVEALREATRRSFRNIVQLAGDARADLLLIAGDIYDGDWRDFQTGLFFAGQMARLQEMGVQVCLIHGNHDAAGKITKQLRLPGNVHTFPSAKASTLLLERLGVAVHGQTYPIAKVTDDLSRNYPAPVSSLLNLGLLHTSANGRPGHEPYAPCQVEQLVQMGYDYWALGHVHAREVVHQDPWIVFPGNIQGRHVRETGPKGCVLVSTDNGRISDVEFHATDVARWSSVEVSAEDCEDLDAVSAQVEHRIADEVNAADGRVLAVRVRITGPSPAHSALHAERDSWVANLRNDARLAWADSVWMEKVLLDTRPPASPSHSEIAQDAMGALTADLASLANDPERLDALVQSLRDFAAKLPVALREGPDAFKFDQAFVLSLLPDVEAELTRRLAGPPRNG